jgi:glycosyltransferase involved in cell wall biosynthesis
MNNVVSQATVEGDAPAAESGLDWLALFERDNGRKLRVLHIGNIANNAYNNAKIQRQYGIDADVVSYDYYHVMACPEWEDANFAGDFGDPFFPDWWKVDLHGFSRPEWFAQGRASACQRYLLARRRRQRIRARVHWKTLSAGRWLQCRSTRTASLARRLARMTARLRLAILYPPARPPDNFAERIAWSTRRFVTRVYIATQRGTRAAAALARGSGFRTATLIMAPRRLAHLAVTPAQRALAAPPTNPTVEMSEAEAALARRYRELFPERQTPLTACDFGFYRGGIERWRALLPHYDVIQAYSTDPIIPVLTGTRAFAAYEHGTLRETPFENTAVGRLCSLSYREAPVVFVTNTDVMPSVERLRIDRQRVVRLPHAVDSERLARFGAEHRDLSAPTGEVVFFSPTRQDWIDAHLSWTKGNDRAIRALALVRDRGYSCRLVLGEWGRDLDASRSLVEELGLEPLVDWTPALRKAPLWTRYLTSHAVLDQFVLPAIGGVAFEAMALGRRVITALDVEATRDFFGEAPPVLACSEPEDIAEAMVSVIQDPADEEKVGARTRAWFERFHSSQRIVELQAEAYRRLLTTP